MAEKDCPACYAAVMTTIASSPWFCEMIDYAAYYRHVINCAKLDPRMAPTSPDSGTPSPRSFDRSDTR